MITASFFPHQGGVESHVKRVSEELIKMGHEIGVLTPKTDENQKDYEKINEIVIFRYPRKSTLRTFFWLFKNRNIISGYDIIHWPSGVGPVGTIEYPNESGRMFQTANLTLNIVLEIPQVGGG